MQRRRHSSRWALWAFAAALLLKSAMPWLASASAEMQGKTLVEVCTVYGVSLVPLGEHGHHPDSGHPADHHDNDHCALTALTALASDEPRLPTLAPAMLRETGPPAPSRSTLPPDACARWVARLKHGPPATA
jgi:hypothetical protein